MNGDKAAIIVLLGIIVLALGAIIWLKVAF